MPAGLDTGLQVVHYLARRVSPATPFGRSPVLLGELPPTPLIQAFSILVTQAFVPNTVQLVLSQNPDGSGFFMATPALNGVGTFSGTPTIDPALDFLRGGKLYLLTTQTFTAGVGLVTLRYFPRTDPLGFG